MTQNEWYEWVSIFLIFKLEIFSLVSIFNFALYVSNNIFNCKNDFAIYKLVVVLPDPATDSTITFFLFF